MTVVLYEIYMEIYRNFYLIYRGIIIDNLLYGFIAKNPHISPYLEDKHKLESNQPAKGTLQVLRLHTFS